MPISRELIDPDAQKVIRRLVRYNHQAYLVGGCVRDLLLGRTPKDFDVATSATPPEIKDLFRNCRIIGRRFRLAHVFFGSKIIETSTFRSNPREVEQEEGGDAETTDLLIRRDNVFGSAEEDARRRDFTMNGLFYDVDAEQVIDYVGGLADLETRTVRTIGDPDIRFREDPVRILRAIKFAARLSFQIEPATYQAILTHKGEIPKCAAPRVLEEIYRLLRGGAARRSLELLLETGVLELLVPELSTLVGQEGDPEGQERLWRVLGRLDVAEASSPSNAVLLCALVGPFLHPGVMDDAVRMDLNAHLDERLRPILQRMRASRRDGERARQILLTLRRLWSGRRRRRPMALVRRDHFDEALQVFDLLGGAMMDPFVIQEEVEKWRRLQQEAERSERPDAAVAAVEGDVRPRRRRRGGRRHRARGSSAAAADTSESAGSEEPLAAKAD
ncbi:MAG TPA: polynucleotide adenylyltransferase PcnB [Polyangia bacterium]|jgi:poly(A) polymerase|nr:polynucleotide adenylyltransferase PcnB [Polyangia bacterium]